MKKKRKVTLPTIGFPPGVFAAIIAGVIGLVVLLCITEKEEIFTPAYEESKSVTDTWDENNALVVLEEQKIPLADGTALLEQVDDLEDETIDKSPEDTESRDADEVDTGYYEADEAEYIEDDKTNVFPEKEEVEPPTQPEAAENVRCITENNVTKDEMADTKPTEKPKPKGDVTNPDKKPEYDEDDLNVDSTSEGNSQMVYDPVFGWIQTEATQYDVIDSDGDIDKQIGTMGVQ